MTNPLKGAVLLVLILGNLKAQAFEVHGHRGCRARFPENTLPAFKHAIEVGVDYLELDLGVTKDGHLIISHDPFMSSTICLGPDGKKIQKEPLIHSLTLAEAKKYDCGTLKNPKFSNQIPVPGTTKPTLDELFDFVEKSDLKNAKTVRFNIETKIFKDHPEATVGPEEFSQLVVDAIRKHRMIERSVIQSFDYRTLAIIKKLEPKLQLAALVENMGPFSREKEFLKIASETGALIISPHYELLTEKIVKALHSHGNLVLPWTPNKEQEWTSLIKMGVDGIITDDPERLIQFLKKPH